MLVFYTLLQWPLLLFAILVALLVLAYLAGRRFAPRSASDDSSSSPLDGVVLALMGLLLAFSYSGAASRYEQRAQLMITESNAIGTAWLRLALLPADAQPAVRAAMRDYGRSRVGIYDLRPGSSEQRRAMQRSTALQQRIWDLAVVAVARDDAPRYAGQLVLPALNDMIDITTSRTMTAYLHTPLPVQLLLLALAMVSTAVIGYATPHHKPTEWPRILCYCTVVAIALYTVIDLEYPRAGLIRLTDFEARLVHLFRTGT